MDAPANRDIPQKKQIIEKTKNRQEVFTFPHLVSLELLAILLACIVLCIWSLSLDAPLKAVADPNWTENPAKAPWYFVGLQEMLVYFDPWIAGVGLPLLIIFGLMAIPYLDPNPAGVGRYNFRDRKFSVSLFTVGYVLWFVLILIGQFLRGPNWQFYWPWEDWATPKEAEKRLVNFSAFWGYLSVAAYVLLGMGLPALIKPSFFRQLGFRRYAVACLLMLLLFAVIIKIFLRIMFHVKYVLVTPYFSI